MQIRQFLPVSRSPFIIPVKPVWPFCLCRHKETQTHTSILVGRWCGDDITNQLQLGQNTRCPNEILESWADITTYWLIDNTLLIHPEGNWVKAAGNQRHLTLPNIHTLHKHHIGKTGRRGTTMEIHNMRKDGEKKGLHPDWYQISSYD